MGVSFITTYWRKKVVVFGGKRCPASFWFFDSFPWRSWNFSCFIPFGCIKEVKLLPASTVGVYHILMWYFDSWDFSYRSSRPPGLVGFHIGKIWKIFFESLTNKWVYLHVYSEVSTQIKLESGCSFLHLKLQGTITASHWGHSGWKFVSLKTQRAVDCTVFRVWCCTKKDGVNLLWEHAHMRLTPQL